MTEGGDSRSERFLAQYRMLEALLEKRYAGMKRTTTSVVREYLRDADSAPWRADLDMCREIRNLLTHNIDAAGGPVVEPSAAVLATLERIVEYVRRPRLAVECGTPADRILFAHPNDFALELVRRMMRAGYSHVPVRDGSSLTGVFSAAGVMRYVAEKGLEGLTDALRVGDMRKALEIRDDRGEQYLFFDRDVTLTAVREAFDKRRVRNGRVAAAFITEDGRPNAGVLAMLTPWDLLRQAEELSADRRQSWNKTDPI